MPVYVEHYRRLNVTVILVIVLKELDNIEKHILLLQKRVLNIYILSRKWTLCVDVLTNSSDHAYNSIIIPNASACLEYTEKRLLW